jgi:protein-S-isoprenylcysteine O-methyltransferase Ste14
MLVALFAFQHSAMAREAGRRFGRALYLIASGIALLLLVGRWHPIPAVIWDVEPALGRAAVHALFAAGWLVLVVSTHELDGLELAGLRSGGTPELRVVGLHRIVRHPTYAGWFLVLWAAPTMTVGHAFLAAALTSYVLVAIRFEERDLVRVHGAEYERYRREVPMLVPRLRRATSTR